MALNETEERFVELCSRLTEMGATEVVAGVYRAQFPRAAPPPPRREREEHHGPPTPRDPDQARRDRYSEIMGERK